MSYIPCIMFCLSGTWLSTPINNAKWPDCTQFEMIHDLHKDTKDIIKIDAIGPTLPHEPDFQHQCFKRFCLFNFQPFYYTFIRLKNFNVI